MLRVAIVALGDEHGAASRHAHKHKRVAFAGGRGKVCAVAQAVVSIVE